MNKESVMKNRITALILTLTMLLSALAACGHSEPDYSQFTMPEETGKLVLYAADNGLDTLLSPALEIFGELYPEVEVSYEICDPDEYQARVREEIPAGGGPDLVLLSSITFPDIYKTMITGVFEDLNPYFETDADITLTDFVEPVMDGGVLNGRRYLAPLNYEMPLILTTKSILNEMGLTVDELKTCDGFVEGATRFHEKHPDATLYFDNAQGYAPYSTDIRTLYKNFGFNFIDYMTGKVAIDAERFKQCMDLVKLYYDPDYDVTDRSKWDIDLYFAGGALHRKLCPFDDFSASSYCNYYDTYVWLSVDEEMPVLFLQANQNEGVTAELGYCAAIPEGSENKANAWKLLKILLSDAIQGGHDENRGGNSYFWSGFPVRLSSTKSALKVDPDLTPDGPLLTKYVTYVQSPTEALLIPQIYRQLIDEEIMPYIRGEKEWDVCYKSFVKALKTYKRSK